MTEKHQRHLKYFTYALIAVFGIALRCEYLREFSSSMLFNSSILPFAAIIAVFSGVCAGLLTFAFHANGLVNRFCLIYFALRWLNPLVMYHESCGKNGIFLLLALEMTLFFHLRARNSQSIFNKRIYTFACGIFSGILIALYPLFALLSLLELIRLFYTKRKKECLLMLVGMLIIPFSASITAPSKSFIIHRAAKTLFWGILPSQRCHKFNLTQITEERYRIAKLCEEKQISQLHAALLQIAERWQKYPESSAKFLLKKLVNILHPFELVNKKDTAFVIYETKLVFLSTFSATLLFVATLLGIFYAFIDKNRLIITLFFAEITGLFVLFLSIPTANLRFALTTFYYALATYGICRLNWKKYWSAAVLLFCGGCVLFFFWSTANMSEAAGIFAKSAYKMQRYNLAYDLYKIAQHKCNDPLRFAGILAKLAKETGNTQDVAKWRQLYIDNLPENVVKKEAEEKRSREQVQETTPTIVK